MGIKTIEIPIKFDELYLYSTTEYKKIKDTPFQMERVSFILEIHTHKKNVNNFFASNLLMNNLKKYLISNVKNLLFRNITKFCIIDDDNISENCFFVYIKYLTKEE